MRIWMQKSASMQKRTSPLKFGHLAGKSEKGSMSNLSTKALAALQERGDGPRALAADRIPRQIQREDVRISREAIADVLAAARPQPELKGSIGEGSNHSNFHIRVRSKFFQKLIQEFFLENSKISE